MITGERYSMDDAGDWAQEHKPPSPMQTHKRARELAVDLAGGLVWGFFAAAYLSVALRARDYLMIGLFLFYALVACFMVVRRPARRKVVWWESVLAWLCVFIPIAGMRPARGGWVVPGLTMQSFGLIGVILALSSLGRSFGIAAADRGLVTTGLYRYVRHPVYAAELVFNAGWVVSNPSWRNLAVLALMMTTQVMRIFREETLIAGYGSYAGQVRWRLFPGIW